MRFTARSTVDEVLRELLVCASEDITRGRCHSAVETLKSMISLLEEYGNTGPRPRPVRPASQAL